MNEYFIYINHVTYVIHICNKFVLKIINMNIFSLMISLLLFFQLSECTLSPPKDRNNKKNKGKIENKVEKTISHNNISMI